MRAMDAGARTVPAERLREISLDELLADPTQEALRSCLSRSPSQPGRRVRKFFAQPDELRTPTPSAGAGALRSQARAARRPLPARRWSGSRPTASAPSHCCAAPTSAARNGSAPMSAGEPAELVFVGGTGRSGTHIVAQLLGEHSRFAAVPIECRFHCNPKGLADVVTGRTTPEEFVRKLRRFWWHRVRARRARRPSACAGLATPARGRRRSGACTRSPPRERLEEAHRRVRGVGADDVVRASRELFFHLLGPARRRGGEAGPGGDELLHDRRRPGLGRIFPEARFVHSVRDGRDSGSSKVSKRQKAHHPTDVDLGDRLVGGPPAPGRGGGARARGRRGPRPRRLPRRAGLGRPRAQLRRACVDFLGIDDELGMRSFFERGDERRRGPPRALARGPREAEQERHRRRLRGGARPDRARGLSLRRACCAARTSGRRAAGAQ